MQAEFYNSCLSESDAHRRMIPLPKPGAPYLINKPEITSRKVAKGDYFLVLGCDGLWDEMSSDQVAEPPLPTPVCVQRPFVTAIHGLCSWSR